MRGGPGLALARSCVEGELNQGKAALQLERHDEAAARWSTLAADKGHGGASCNLARMYAAGGPGLPADRAQAEKWGKVAVARGFPDPLRAPAEPARRAPEALAVSKEGDRLFSAGDMAGAARTYARRADVGDASCQLNLGWLHEQGKGVPQCLATAVRWCRAAAEQNNPKGEENLGNMYQLGRGARMYHYGFGVKEDKAKAHALYRQSAALGNHKAGEAPIGFDRFSWPDQKSQDIYTARRNSTPWHSIS